MDPIIQILKVSRLMGKDTLQFNNVDINMPGEKTHYLITNSNLGNIQKIIKNCDDFLFLLHYGTNEDSYAIPTYVYYDENVFKVGLMTSTTSDRKYLECIKEQYNLIINIADKI